MKKFLAILPMLAFAIFSCQKSDVEPVSKEVFVGLKPCGEISVTTTPLAKATATDTRDLYGVQIEKIIDGSGSKTHYAYGIFDDMSIAQVRMYTTDKYEVEVAYIPDGKDIVKLNGGTEELGNWDLPFNNSLWNVVALNEFTYDKTSELFSLDKPWVISEGGERTDGQHRSGISYYYALIEEYTPAETNPVLNVNLLRYNFGLEFIFKSEDYSDCETILIQLDTDASVHESHYAAITPSSEYSTLTISPILLGNVRTVNISIGTDADPTVFYDGQIAVYRNEMYHITVNRHDDSVTPAVTLTVDSDDMTDVNKDF